MIIIAIIMLLMFRKELLTKVHSFIHLNLSISLLLGYVVFLSGVDTAVANEVSLELCIYINYAVLYILVQFTFMISRSLPDCKSYTDSKVSNFSAYLAHSQRLFTVPNFYCICM